MADPETPDVPFIKLGASRGLTKKTMQTLFDSGFSNKDDLSEITERQMRDLDIPAAQKFRMRKLVEDLLVSRNDEPEQPPAGPQETMEVSNEAVSDAASSVADSEVTTTTDVSQEAESLALSAIPKETMISKMLRPHESVFGEKTKDGSFLQFIYANLLTLENMYRTDQRESVGYLHHLHFLTLKLMQQYPVEKVFQYDHVVRTKVESNEITWQDRSNIGLDDEIVTEHFDDEHLQRWKKMRRQNTKALLEAFKTDRCLLWNYSKEDAPECTAEECKFIHSCLACGGTHSLMKCPTNHEKKKRTIASKQAVSPRPALQK